MLTKTFSTSRTNVLLQKQYREKDFKKCYELISCLLVSKQKKMNYSLKWIQYQRIIIVVGLNVMNFVIVIDPTTTKMQVTTRSGRIIKIIILKMSVFLAYFDFALCLFRLIVMIKIIYSFGSWRLLCLHIIFASWDVYHPHFL